MTPREKDDTGVIERERRRHARHPVVKFIWYKILDDDSEEKPYPVEGISKTCDISAGGIGLYVPYQVPKGKLIFMEVAAKEFGITFVGKIVNIHRENENYYRAGIVFKAISPTDYIKLKRYLEKDATGRI